MKLNLILFTLLTFCITANATTLKVKYLERPVNVTKNGFENFKKSSSLINDSWYDKNNNYLILNIQGTSYHYCGFGRSEWESFKKSESLGQHYIRNIKGRFDCRQIPPPAYK
jgi:hypothetical protein